MLPLQKPRVERGPKPTRREIANSNERKRMHSINVGFQHLKSLLPLNEDRISKSAILQQAVEYISKLESDRSRLVSHNTVLTQRLSRLDDSDPNDRHSLKRKKISEYDCSTDDKLLFLKEHEDELVLSECLREKIGMGKSERNLVSVPSLMIQRQLAELQVKLEGERKRTRFLENVIAKFLPKEVFERQLEANVAVVEDSGGIRVEKGSGDAAKVRSDNIPSIAQVIDITPEAVKSISMEKS